MADWCWAADRRYRVRRRGHPVQTAFGMGWAGLDWAPVRLLCVACLVFWLLGLGRSMLRTAQKIVACSLEKEKGKRVLVDAVC